MDECQCNAPEMQKKVYTINEALLINNKIVDKNYSKIKEINNYLFAGKSTLLAEDEKKLEMPNGWFDRVIEILRIINCRNTDIEIQLEKLQKEVICK